MQSSSSLSIDRHQIETRVSHGFLARTQTKLPRLRKLLVGRQWNELRKELIGIAQHANRFGFTDLTREAERILVALPESGALVAESFPEAQHHCEALFRKIEELNSSNPNKPEIIWENRSPSQVDN